MSDASLSAIPRRRSADRSPADGLAPRASASVRRRRGLRSFLRDRRATAAVEFALTLPFLVTLLFTGVDITQAVSARRKAVSAAGTISDLVSQMKQVSATDVSNAFTVAGAIMAPFKASDLQAIVSNVTIDNSGTVKVAWSRASNTTARTVGSAMTLPAGLKVANTALVVSEVTYRYKPLVGYSAIGDIVMTKTSYAAPRVASKATGVACIWSGC